MGIYGDRDIIVHPKQWQPMQKGISNTQIERFPLAGHFVMLEEPQAFSEKLKLFLDKEISSQPVSQTQSSSLDQKTSAALTP
jgi:pimeloyl-ACP methyl ester carboxylesterase